MGDVERAEEVLSAALDAEPLSLTLYLHLMQLQALRSPPSVKGVERVWERVQASQLPHKQQLSLALHRLQLLNEFGGDIHR